jgi:hypothetical protein
LQIQQWGVPVRAGVYDFGGRFREVETMPEQETAETRKQKKPRTRAIASAGSEVPKWDPANPADSLKNVFRYVVDEAGKSTEWYWRNKRWKARLSQFIRFLAWMLTAVGGLLPVIGSLFGSTKLNNGLWASLLLGTAASLLGLDKAFGYSSGWARYVLTATSIRKTLEEFRMDWAELMANAGNSPTPEQVVALIDRAKKFRVDVEALVLQETKDWVTEFQASMAQMEKDLTAQLASLKTQVDKTIAAREAAAQPGAIQLTIQNSNKAAPGSLKVTLIDSSNQSVQEPVTGSSWGKINVTPGQYQLKLDAIVNGQPVQQQSVVVVKGGQSENVQIAL